MKRNRSPFLTMALILILASTASASELAGSRNVVHSYVRSSGSSYTNVIHDGVTADIRQISPNGVSVGTLERWAYTDMPFFTVSSRCVSTSPISPQPSEVKTRNDIPFTGFGDTPEAAARMALAQCYHQLAKTGVDIRKIRLSDGVAVELKGAKLQTFRDGLKNELETAGIQSCLKPGMTMNKGERCSLERNPTLRERVVPLLTDAALIALGALAFRVRGGAFMDGKFGAASKLAFMAVNAAIGGSIAGKDGAVAGSLLFAGTQVKGWGDCFDYGRAKGRSVEWDRSECAARLPMIGAYSAQYLQNKGYGPQMGASSLAIPLIYDASWRVSSEHGKGGGLAKSVEADGPTERAEWMTGALMTGSLISSLRHGPAGKANAAEKEAEKYEAARAHTDLVAASIQARSVVNAGSAVNQKFSNSEASVQSLESIDSLGLSRLLNQ